MSSLLARAMEKLYVQRLRTFVGKRLRGYLINSRPPSLAGIDTKKEASEIQKPRSGDRRSRTDDPLLAKQML